MNPHMPKILCLAGYNLDRPDCGATVRALNVFRLLARIGQVRIVLASRHEEHLRDANSSLGGFELVHVVRFQPAGKRTLTDRWRYEFDGRFLNTYGYQAVAKDVERLQALIATHDLVWIHGLRIANGFGLWRWPHSILDLDDIPSCVDRTAMAQARSVLEKLRRYRQVLIWQRREKFLMERFAAICVTNAPDRTELCRELGVSDRISVVPNGFTVPRETPSRRPSVPPRVGFVGSFHHTPNRDGLRWFIKHVWPQILQSMPETKLRVVGEGSEKEVWPTDTNIDRLGWVSDVESEMATWSLTVVPIFFGGGTRVKIAEAFSRKCPVVSTTLGIYGYEVVDGREVLIADSPEDFAARCLRLLANPSEGAAIAENAWQGFLDHWTWDSYADRVAGVVEKVLQRIVGVPNREAVSDHFGSRKTSTSSLISRR
jgi:glycosyltransferase involved in cell wall biosynthesis